MGCDLLVSTEQLSSKGEPDSYSQCFNLLDTSLLCLISLVYSYIVDHSMSLRQGFQRSQINACTQIQLVLHYMSEVFHTLEFSLLLLKSSRNADFLE